MEERQQKISLLNKDHKHLSHKQRPHMLKSDSKISQN